MVAKNVHLRQHYHFGPLKIAMHLKRYCDIEISDSGAWKILGMGRLPANQRYKQRWKRSQIAFTRRWWIHTTGSLNIAPATVPVSLRCERHVGAA